MRIKEALNKIKTIQIPKKSLPVEETCAAEILEFIKIRKVCSFYS